MVGVLEIDRRQQSNSNAYGVVQTDESAALRTTLDPVSGRFHATLEDQDPALVWKSLGCHIPSGCSAHAEGLWPDGLRPLEGVINSIPCIGLKIEATRSWGLIDQVRVLLLVTVIRVDKSELAISPDPTTCRRRKDWGIYLLVVGDGFTDILWCRPWASRSPTRQLEEPVLALRCFYSSLPLTGSQGRCLEAG